MLAVDHAPAHQRAQVHAHVAPADVETLHDLVGGERLAGNVEQGVDLAHGLVQAPDRHQVAPLVDEPVLDFVDGVRHPYSP